MKAKLYLAALALCTGGALVGSAHAAGVTKSIKLTAEINDAIFVSKADGTTWYDTVQLMAEDYTQQKFASQEPGGAPGENLHVRVWTKQQGFQVTLQGVPELIGPGGKMKNVQVFFAPTVTPATPALTANVIKKFDDHIAGDAATGYAQLYELKVTAEGPAKDDGGSPTPTSIPVNGSYFGKLTMLFEPKA